jgi:cytochrome c oxidase subunit 2
MNIKFLPIQASNFASELDWLFFTLVAITVFFTTFIFCLVLFLAVKYKKRKGNDYEPRQHEHPLLEIVWSSIPLVIGLGLFWWGADLFLRMYSEPPAGAIDVYVTGKQWMWKFQYPDGKREINTLHVPVGKPVKLTMVSEDVIHSFFIPDFRVKHDVVPMRYTSLWFEATTPGVYAISCSQYCGTKHSEMIGKVHVLSEKEYADWLGGGGSGGSVTAAATTSSPSKDSKNLAAVGKEVYTRLACASCHLNPQIAPLHTGLFGRSETLITGEQIKVDENYIRESILRPSAKVVKGYQPVMPAYQGQVSEEELQALIAYLKTLGK